MGGYPKNSYLTVKVGRSSLVRLRKPGHVPEALLTYPVHEVRGTPTPMKYVQTIKWPSFASFLLLWVVAASVTWGLVCLFSAVVVYRELDAGMIPAHVLLALALIPILIVTLIVETVLFLVGHIRLPDSPETGKRLVLFGTLPVTWVCLWLITLFCGGLDAFIVRI
jgi:hypothetical protein